ncbi:hypothetical protein niasHT_014906 [Heterodera trifolii]|uniref:Uncharacterized protein n=1 Tax=Heterodera trifolii TaxID=157864 RepID=A0ABD2LFK4_9BILA
MTRTRCDLMGKECEPTRELLRKIRKISKCCSPSNAAGPCICKLPKPDPSEFAAPAHHYNLNEFPLLKYGNSQSEDPLDWTGDVLYTEEQAQRFA